MNLRIPKRFIEARLSGVDSKQFAELHTWWWRDFRDEDTSKGLLLSGPPGVGKTWAMAALTREYRRLKRGDYEFVTAPDFFEHLNEFDNEQWDEYRDQSWMVTYQTTPWLVINDLGKEYRGGKLSEQATYRFGRILRARSEEQCITHITTNLTGAALQDTYGESIASLLSEMTEPVTIVGKDRRRKK